MPMTTSTPVQDSPHNHWRCKGPCSARPLTLADRELITGRSIVCHDKETGTDFCGDCLADLPAGFAALFHVCGEEPAPEAPAGPDPQAMVASLSAGQATTRAPMAGDVVRYHGSLTEYHGVYEVVWRRNGRLRLFDGFGVALANVPPEHVTIGGRKARKRLQRHTGTGD